MATLPRTSWDRLHDPDQRQSSKQLLFILGIIAVYLLLTLYRLGWPDLSPDEGRYGLTAVNILTDSKQLAVLSEDPLGKPGSKPFMYAVSLAGSLAVFGKNEFALRVVGIAGLLAAGLILFALVDSWFDDRRLSNLTLGFFLLSPWTISYARTAMPEPILVLWGCFAVFAPARFIKTQRLIWAAGCGLGLGLAFLTKLWLVFPFAISSMVFFSAAWFSGRRQEFVIALLVSLFVFLLTSTSHLLLAFIWTPADLAHWFQLYFIESLSSRVAGAGHDPAMWFRPWWFYLAGLFKVTFFGLPVILLGILGLLRRQQLGLLAVVAAMLSPFLVLSLFVVKQTSYAYSAFPAIAFLLAYGTVVINDTRPRHPLIVSALLSEAAALLFLILGTITGPECIVITGLYLLYIVWSLAREEYRAATGIALAATVFSAMVAADFLAVRISFQHRTHYRELASCLRPLVAQAEPQSVIFVAPEYPSLEFHLFRSGEYWQTYYFHESYDKFLNDLRQGNKAFYIVDPTATLYGGAVPPVKLNALRQYAIDDANRVEQAIGRKSGLKLFISRAWASQSLGRCL